MRQNHDKLLKQLEYSFRDEQLLSLALTHRSAGGQHNERLEYLGDAVLGAVIADELFRRLVNENEGTLSRLRASLVKKETLAEIARELDLGSHLKLGSGELKSGGFRRDSILADAVEAILAAIYLDSDFEQCRTVILSLYRERLANLDQANTLKDPKTRLQELLQARKLELPVYEVDKVEGESHDQTFYVSCHLGKGLPTSQGQGQSRRRAEQAAAEEALRQLEEA